MNVNIYTKKKIGLFIIKFIRNIIIYTFILSTNKFYFSYDVFVVYIISIYWHNHIKDTHLIHVYKQTLNEKQISRNPKAKRQTTKHPRRH